jgi:hypothetical protein
MSVRMPVEKRPKRTVEMRIIREGELVVVAALTATKGYRVIRIAFLIAG